MAHIFVISKRFSFTESGSQRLQKEILVKCCSQHFSCFTNSYNTIYFQHTETEEMFINLTSFNQ